VDVVDGKGSFRWTGLVIMAVIVALMVSCSRVTPSPSVQSSPVPESTPEFKPAPATADVSPGPTTAPSRLSSPTGIWAGLSILIRPQ